MDVREGSRNAPLFFVAKKFFAFFQKFFLKYLTMVYHSSIIIIVRMILTMEVTS